MRPAERLRSSSSKNPRVMIFDEATSSLDPDTAERFAATVDSLRGRVAMLSSPTRFRRAWPLTPLCKSEASHKRTGRDRAPSTERQSWRERRLTASDKRRSRLWKRAHAPPKEHDPEQIARARLGPTLP